MDLFDASPVPGLLLQPQFVGEAEEAGLIASIDRLDMKPFRFQQWTGKRLSQSFGWHYDFQAGTVSRTTGGMRYSITFRTLSSPGSAVTADQ